LNLYWDGATVIYAEGNLVLAGAAGQVRQALAIARGTASSGFTQRPLYHRVQQAYAEGVGWLVAADLQRIAADGGKEATLLGLSDAQQLVLEQKTGYGSTASRATLGFSQPRRSVVSWLAPPAPMGSLEFVSPDAYLVSAALVKDPALILDDVFSIMTQDPDGLQELQSIQQRLQVDLRRDIAEPFGNEFLMALDGPVLPSPSWKIVAEVRDAPRVENTINWLVTNANREMELAGLARRLTLSSETVEGRTYHSIRASTDNRELIHYTFWMGYMLVSPSRPLLFDTIKNYDSGNTLARSGKLRQFMPAENQDHYSALMYQNIQQALAGSPALQDLVGNVVDEFITKGLPAVVCVYGEPDRILASARGSFGVNLAGMLGLQGVLAAAGLN
jgi:hypothetical protein